MPIELRGPALKKVNSSCFSRDKNAGSIYLKVAMKEGKGMVNSSLVGNLAKLMTEMAICTC